MRIFLDMDGTLCDFKAAFARFIGVDTYKYRDRFFSNLKQLHGFSDVEVYTAFEKHFWAIVDTIPKFWEGIPPMSDFNTLWHFLKPYHPIILTAIPEHNGTREVAIEGKRKWVDKYMGSSIEMIVVHLDSANHKISDKAKYCEKTSDILIDDNELNIQTWKNKGGKAIHYTSAHTTIMELKGVIHKIEQEREITFTNFTYIRGHGSALII